MDLEELMSIPQNDWPDLYMDQPEDVLELLKEAFDSSDKATRQFALEGVVRSFLPVDFENASLPTTLTDEEQGDTVDFQDFVVPVVKMIQAGEETAAATHALWVLARHGVTLPDVSQILIKNAQGPQKETQHWGAPLWVWSVGTLFHVAAQNPKTSAAVTQLVQSAPEFEDVFFTEIRTNQASKYDLQVFEPLFTKGLLSGDPNQVPRSLFCLSELVKRGGRAPKACEAVAKNINGFGDPLEAMFFVVLHHLQTQDYAELENLCFAGDQKQKTLVFDSLTAIVQSGVDLSAWLKARNVKDKLLAEEKTSRRNPNAARGALVRCLENDGRNKEDDSVQKRIGF